MQKQKGDNSIGLGSTPKMLMGIVQACSGAISQRQIWQGVAIQNLAGGDLGHRCAFGSTR
jgi:hypothetical protein